MSQRQLCYAGKWTFSLAGQQGSVCQLYGGGSPLSHGHRPWEQGMEGGLSTVSTNLGESLCFILRKTVTLESTKHEMGTRDLESWILLDLAGRGAGCVSLLQSLHFSESYFLICKGRAFSDDLRVFLGYTFG